MIDRKILLTVLVSAVVAGGAVQLLHAQTKPPVYAIAMVNVKDVDGYTKEFLPKVQPAIKEYGGEYLAGGMKKTTAFAGEQPPNRVVVLKFPNDEAWKKFEDGPNGKTLREEVSKKYADWKALWVVEGVEQK
jgi:uncharacterized protein (DUF1330 family)